MKPYMQSLKTAEVMALSPEEKAQYVHDRKYHRRWQTRMLKEQTWIGLGMTVLSLIIPTGLSFFTVPLGIWMIVRAQKRDIVIV